MENCNLQVILNIVVSFRPLCDPTAPTSLKADLKKVIILNLRKHYNFYYFVSFF